MTQERVLTLGTRYYQHKQAYTILNRHTIILITLLASGMLMGSQ